MQGLLLAIQRRARTFSLASVVAYVSIFMLLSVAHCCDIGLRKSADATPAHAHKLTAPSAVGHADHTCLACSWQRDTTSTLGAVFRAPLPVCAALAAPRSSIPALLAGLTFLQPSRGPPAS